MSSKPFISDMKRFTTLLILLPLLATAGDDPTFPPDAICGTWETSHDADGWSLIEIVKTDNTYEGHITWINNEVYDDDDDMAGQPVVDRENPDPDLRDRSLIGVRLMHSFVYDKNNRWKDGRIYDPNNGKDYRCKLTLQDINTLDVRGYVKLGFIKLGSTTTWTRVDSTTTH